MTIYSSHAPRPLLTTKARDKLNKIRIKALVMVPLEMEPPRVAGWFHTPSWIRVLRHRLYLYMEEPLSSKKSLIFNAFLGVCNILSTLTYCLESLPYYRGDETSISVWYWWEVILMSVFTFELVLRAPAHTTVRQFVFSRPEILVDCIACVPFDIYLFGHVHLSILDTRWIRPIRLLRLVKLGNNILDLRLILTGVYRSIWMIALVWCLAILFIFSFASILFIVERGPWDPTRSCYLALSTKAAECTQFESVPISLYFAMEVASGTGYGDIVPHSTIGRWITMILMLMAVCIIALTITLFSIQFGRVYDTVLRDMRISILKEAADLVLRLEMHELHTNDPHVIGDVASSVGPDVPYVIGDVDVPPDVPYVIGDVETSIVADNVPVVAENATDLYGVQSSYASCRLVTCIEILEAISLDLARVMKSVRSDLVTLSELGTPGAISHNKRLGASRKSLAVIIEQLLAELAANAFNDVDTLTTFVLNTTEDLVVGKG